MKVLDIAWQSWPDDGDTAHSHRVNTEYTILFHIPIPTLFVQTIINYVDLCAKSHGCLTLFTHNEATCKHMRMSWWRTFAWRVPELSLQYAYGLSGTQAHIQSPQWIWICQYHDYDMSASSHYWYHNHNRSGIILHASWMEHLFSLDRTHAPKTTCRKRIS